MLLAVEHRLVDVGPELAALGGDAGLGDQPHQLLVAAPVPDQVGDGDDGQVVLLGEPLELGQARHLRLVLGHDLAQHPGRGEAGGPGQVDGGLGVPGPLEHPAGAVAQGEDVPRPVQVGGLGAGSIRAPMVAARSVGRDPGRGAVAVVHADGEGGALGLGVGRDHERAARARRPARAGGARRSPPRCGPGRRRCSRAWPPRPP